ncbi:MAG TPA: sensor histidine kinase [Streptosporangiaceae bacterium]
MRDPDPSDEPALPLVRRLAAHPFTNAQLLAVDVVTVSVITVVVQLAMSRQAPRVSGTVWETASWAGYLVAAGATLWRRRLPRTTLAVVLPIAVAALSLRAGGGTVFYVVLALYSLVAVSSRRAALIAASLTGSTVLAATVVGGGQMVVAASIGGAALTGLAWVAGENTRASRVYAAQHAERTAEKAAAVTAERAEQVRRALGDERAEIARELHDIVAHAMSLIAVRAGVARMVIDTDPAQAREALSIIETTTRQSLQEMRLLVGVLRDPQQRHPDLSPVPGLGDLDRLIAATAAAGVTAEVSISGVARALSPAADLSAYRIVQEALTNVVRHAGPTRARVRVTYRPDAVSIEVADDGPSKDAPRPSLSRVSSGHGLIGMRERAALFGGELAAAPHARGFRVQATLHTADTDARDLTARPLEANGAAR